MILEYFFSVVLHETFCKSVFSYLKVPDEGCFSWKNSKNNTVPFSHDICDASNRGVIAFFFMYCVKLHEERSFATLKSHSPSYRVREKPYVLIDTIFQRL